LKLVYFAWVRERIGKSDEDLSCPEGVGDINALVDHLINLAEGYKNAFENRDKVKVAINQNHVNWDHPVKEGDEVAFFPPVTGG